MTENSNTKGQPTTIRLPKITQEQIKFLNKKFGLSTMTQVLIYCVNEVARKSGWKDTE